MSVTVTPSKTAERVKSDSGDLDVGHSIEVIGVEDTDSGVVRGEGIHHDRPPFVVDVQRVDDHMHELVGVEAARVGFGQPGDDPESLG